MKFLASAIAASIVILTPVAHAAETWQFNALSLTTTNVSNGLTLLSQSATATVVSFDSLSAASLIFASLDDIAGGRNVEYGVGHSGMPFWEDYTVRTTAGYRVTGVTIDLTLRGELRPGAPNGEAENALSLGISLNNGGDSVSWHSGITNNLNGSQTIAGGLDVVGGTDFDLDFQGELSTYALAALSYNPRSNTYYFVDESFANIGAENVTLTFHTAPVPEPQTYLMLGVGLALMAGFARRRHIRRQ